MAKDGKGKAAVRSGGADATHTDSPLRSTQSKRKRPAPSTLTSNGASSSKSKPQHAHKKPRNDRPQASASSGLPGASKLKSSIRQTKRLLAKPNLAPGTKIEAERRLRALEADLEVQSRRQVEKSRASRYHRIKFVERQKLVRRIARCKRNLDVLESGDSLREDSDSDSDAEDQARVKKQASKMSRSDLVDSLKELRELLHYVIQYPPDLRYVALFPNADSGPVPPNANEDDKSRQKAYVHLETVRKAIESQQLSSEPEVELASKDGPRSKLVRATAQAGASTSTPREQAPKGKSKSTKSNAKRTDSQQAAGADDDTSADEQADGVKGDDFFANSDDDE
ncbi:hypothetical protein L1887_57118 [Cichorium endivia]|nr:hypothetical protein L1887_57118 [Cichorium endivia]